VTSPERDTAPYVLHWEYDRAGEGNSVKRTKGTCIAALGMAGMIALGGCSSGTGTTAQSSTPSTPTTVAASPTTSADTFTVTVGDWELTLANATEAPSSWRPDIPAPEQGVLQAAGTGEPIQTTSDHPVVAVEYMAPGEVATVTKEQLAAMTADGWKKVGASKGITIFIKGNDSARVAVKPNPSTGGVTVYQWF
jgi:hypothetical protein